jgi:hypothetical protein
MELFAGLEADSLARGDGDLGACSRIASDAGLSRFDGKYAKASELDAVACYKGLLHAVEDCIYGSFCFSPWQARAFDNPLYKILLNHAAAVLGLVFF